MRALIPSEENSAGHGIGGVYFNVKSNFNITRFPNSKKNRLPRSYCYHTQAVFPFLLSSCTHFFIWHLNWHIWLALEGREYKVGTDEKQKEKAQEIPSLLSGTQTDAKREKKLSSNKSLSVLSALKYFFERYPLPLPPCTAELGMVKGTWALN